MFYHDDLDEDDVQCHVIQFKNNFNPSAFSIVNCTLLFVSDVCSYIEAPGPVEMQ